MFIFPKKKIAILLNAKTGTTVLSQLIRRDFKEEFLHSPGVHITIENLLKLHEHWLENHNLLDIENYTVYCFYRDPIDRFISAYGYIIRQMNFRPLNIWLWNPIFGVDINKTVDDVTPTHIIDLMFTMSLEPKEDSGKFHNIIEIAFTNQIYMIKNEKIKINLLNFHDYESEIHRLWKILGKEFKGDIPIMNKGHLDSKNILTEEDKYLLNKYYAQDYEYLKNVNITRT